MLGFLLLDLVKTKGQKIAIGFISFMIFVGGMGLIARLGFRHGEAFPFWINLKILMWVLVNIVIIMIGRTPRNLRKWMYGLIMLLVIIAVYAAVNKPTLS